MQDDAFLPDNPEVRAEPIALEILEARHLVKAMSERPSLPVVREALRSADRHELELLAMIGIAAEARARLSEGPRGKRLSEGEADARWVRWLVGAQGSTGAE